MIKEMTAKAPGKTNEPGETAESFVDLKDLLSGVLGGLGHSSVNVSGLGRAACPPLIFGIGSV